MYFVLPTESEIGQVEVVEGLNVTLPCNVEHPPNDIPVLTLWYIGPEETPVYSYDQRPRSNNSDWSDPTVFGYNRVRFMPHWQPQALHFRNVNREDSRVYRCRIDFLHSNSRMAWIRLLVIVPTARLDLTVHQTPVMPGTREDVTCMASGGWPPARIIWLQDGQVVDANYKINKKKGISHNALEAGASSGDILSPFVCQASNNDITTPLMTTYTRNVTFGPLSVMVEVSAWPQVEGVEVYLRCTVVGSNPPAKVQWYQHRRPLTRGTVNVTRVGDVTISVLRLVPMRELHGRQIVCRAENPMVIRSAVEDIVTLDVSYRPNATVTLVWPQIERNLQEGTKLLLQCHVDANPSPQTFAWLHNGQKLTSNETLGLLLTWSHLTLQRATRDWSGAYQCAAANVEGEATSNTVVVKIKYAPRCLSPPSFRGLALFDPAVIDCDVDADPDNVTFRWTFTKSTGNDRFRLLPEHWYSSTKLRSTLKYVANTPGDFGEISCEATNAVGRQAVPCKTTLVSVGLPEEVRGCLVTNVTTKTATINCMAGFDGGLKQSFQLQVWQSQNEELVFSDILESGTATKYGNASRSVNTSLHAAGQGSEHDYDKYPIFGDGDVFQPERIQFFVPSLKPNMHYFAEVTSMNSRGQSRPKKFHIRTLSDGTEPPSSPRPRPKSLPPKRIKLPPSQPATPSYELHTTHSYGQGFSIQEKYSNSRIFLWVMAVVLGVGLALFGVGFGVYMGKRQIVTCWYLTCGRLCRGGCCGDVRGGNCCSRCIGCWKRCKARSEDCIVKSRGSCTTECCKEQLTGCKCLRTCCMRFKPRGVPKFCQRDIKGEDEEGKPPVSCCMELSICRKAGDDGEPTLDMASGLRGPALQLHRGGTLLLRRALSNTDSTTGSIKRKKDGGTDGEGSYMNGMLEQTIYDSSGKYRGFAHIPSQLQVGARRTPEPINEAAPNSTSPSDPLLVNGKKLSFKESKPPAVVMKDKEESSARKDPERTAFEVENRTVTDLTDPEEQRETEGANRDSGDSEGDRNRPGAPKFSAVLRNFRPPSLAKFVPKVKTAANPGCDV
ncbi:CD80-like immunoglobulin C2-set [Trinorchestia longiramus]|nr:CD80-like immunoglobulin C2-set [Trinorchestia longiramus]